MASIFTIERRKNFWESFTRFVEDIYLSKITTSANAHYKMADYLDRCIRYWPHRCGAVSIEAYLYDIGVDLTNPEDESDCKICF